MAQQASPPPPSSFMNHRCPPLYVCFSTHTALLSVGCPCPVVSGPAIEGRSLLQFVQLRPGANVQQRRPHSGNPAAPSVVVVVDPPADVIESLMLPAVLQAWHGSLPRRSANNSPPPQPAAADRTSSRENDSGEAEAQLDPTGAGAAVSGKLGSAAPDHGFHSARLRFLERFGANAEDRRGKRLRGEETSLH